MPDIRDTMRGADAATNPRRTLKRREEEADAGTAADAPPKRSLMDRALEDDAASSGGVKFTTGPRTRSAEEQAKQDAKLRELLARQRR